MNAKAVMIMTTVDSDELASKLAGALLRNRQAACVQELGIRSRYVWDGELRCDDETLLLVKTSAACAPAAMRTIEDNHSYDVPEIVLLPITDGLPAYLEWLDRETGQE